MRHPGAVPAVIPTRPALLAASLGELTAWNLVVRCPCRSYPRSVPIAEIALERGRRMLLGQAVARLRCAQCGNPPVSVLAIPGSPFASRAWKIRLL